MGLTVDLPVMETRYPCTIRVQSSIAVLDDINSTVFLGTTDLVKTNLLVLQT